MTGTHQIGMKKSNFKTLTKQNSFTKIDFKNNLTGKKMHRCPYSENAIICCSVFSELNWYDISSSLAIFWASEFCQIIENHQNAKFTKNNNSKPHNVSLYVLIWHILRLLVSLTLISRKIWETDKFFNFHTVSLPLRFYVNSPFGAFRRGATAPVKYFSSGLTSAHLLCL